MNKLKRIRLTRYHLSIVHDWLHEREREGYWDAWEIINLGSWKEHAPYWIPRMWENIKLYFIALFIYLFIHQPNNTEMGNMEIWSEKDQVKTEVKKLG